MQISKVILAGAGPGDASLITVKLMQALQSADVILVDRLVNQEIIKLYANESTEIIPVGKEGYEENSMPQTQINDLIIHHALLGKKVLRLKGGDVAIYSNVIEEIKSLILNHLDFEIIPGITAASGIAASLGIPLTGRDLAPGVQIHSLSTADTENAETLKAWALTKDTLVYYMSTTKLKSLVNSLLVNGSVNKSIAIIEQGTTEFQKNTISSLNEIIPILDKTNFQSPTLIIIGDILKLVNLESTNTIETKAFFQSINTINKKLYAV